MEVMLKPKKIEDKKAEATAKKVEAPAKKVEKKETKKVAKKNSGKREVVTIYPSQNKIVLKEGDNKFKAYYHIRRRDKVEFIAISPENKSTPLKEWLES